MTPELGLGVAPFSIDGPQCLRVVDSDYKTDPRYLEYLTTHPDCLIFHHPSWLSVIEAEYGSKCLSLACERSDGSLTGILPLFYTRGLPLANHRHRLGARLSSL